MYWALFVAVTALLVLVVDPVFAQAAPSAGTTNASVTAPLAKDLYCSTFNLLSSDIGIFIGLLVAFLGFLLFTTQEYPAASLIMMAGGVLISAMPGLFISGLEGIAPIVGQLSDTDPANKFKNLCP